VPPRPGANLALDLAVLRTRGTIATYANDGGGKPVELDVCAVPIPGDA
jgi:NADPH2:quinone reductase